MRRPYYDGIRDYDNPVYVIGHHDKRIQFGGRKMIGNGLPAVTYDFAVAIQLHLSVHNLAE
jgi:hypothetical protein